jgi:UDP:flavonoid glycosyltransferase YjiC (YdhE family)
MAPHVVFMNFPATGHMNPTLPIVAELRRQGAEVTYYVAEKMRAPVEAAGATWRPLADVATPAVHDAAAAKYVESDTPEELRGFPYNMLAVTEYMMPSLLADLRALEQQPTVIVYDPFLPCGLIASQELGVPCMGFVSVPGPGTINMPDAAQQMWESHNLVQKPRKAILDTYGIDLLKHGRILEVYSHMQNIVTTIGDLYAPPSSDMQKERFGHFPFTCVGALIDLKTKRIANAHIEGAPTTLPHDRIERELKAGTRVLYISLGTVANSHFWTTKFGNLAKQNGLAECTGKDMTQHVFKNCFDAFGGNDKILVIMALGPQEDVLEGLPATPDNFILRTAVPQLEVLNLCHAFITHGGANSVHEALSFGVPLAVVPLFGDQPPNADSVVSMGAGVGFKNPLDSVTVPALREAVDGLLDASDANTYRAGALKAKKKLADAGGVPKAVDMILELSSDATARRGGA